jgi:hypothetical protein
MLCTDRCHKKKSITDRYQATEDGQIIIDASVRKVEDLYSDFDRTAPYLKKDLDGDFVDYLIDCAKEIDNPDFVIRISLTQEPDEFRIDRVRNSIRNFFLYLQELEIRAIKTMFRRTLILLGIGLGLLILAILAHQRFSAGTGVLSQVFSEGLTIAAWVSLWEATANLFLEWHPHRRNMKLYRRIMAAPVSFTFPSHGMEDKKETS